MNCPFCGHTNRPGARFCSGLRAISPQHPISVDKQPVSGEQRLRHGVEIALGGMTLRYHEQAAKCPQCGKENPLRAKFCPGCGKQLVVK